MKSDLLTVNQAAEALGKRPETLRRWIAAGKIEAERQGGRVLIPLGALEALRVICERCGQPYTPKRPTSKSRFCSDRCRWAEAHEKRKRENPAKRKPGRPPKYKTPEEIDLGNERLSAALKKITPSD